MEYGRSAHGAGPLTAFRSATLEPLREALVERTLAAEHAIAGVRLLVVASGTVIYPFMVKERTVPWLAYSLLAGAWGYGLAVWIWRPYRRFPALGSAAFTTATDAVFTMLWLYATGGWSSPFYVALYPSVFAVAFRFSVAEAFAAAGVYGGSYLVMLALLGQQSGHGAEPVVRIVYLFLSGALGSVISREMDALATARAELRAQVIRREVELERVERESEAQRMALVGRLAGGVAHDFNNLLTTILGYTEMLFGLVGRRTPQRRYLEGVREAGERAAALTRQLLAYGRRQFLRPERLDLSEVVLALEPLLRGVLGERATLRVVTDSKAGHTTADRAQIDQLLVNLAMNAREAMPAGGTLSVEVGRVSRPAGPSSDPLAPPPGDWIRLTVTDTGVGMDPETLGRLFEPFFSSVPRGKGVGLGLAAVGGIVEQHGGAVRCDSAPGRGATFAVYFPRAPE